MFEHRNEEKIDIYCYLIKPAALDSLQRIKTYDESAARTIADAQQVIEQLTAYRAELLKRFNDIYGASYNMQLKLQRKHDYYYKRTSYTVTVCKVYDRADIAAETVLNESYTGKERHAALKRFEMLKKLYPGINTVKDIEKSKWEK